MSIEIHTANPEEHKYWKEKILIERNEILKNLEPASKNKELNEILSNFDDRTFREIIEEMFKRCGLEPKKDINFLGQENLYSCSEQQGSGYYLPQHNIIALDYSFLKQRIQEKLPAEVHNKEMLIILVIRTLIHEMLHALSTRSIYFTKYDDKDLEVISSGLSVKKDIFDFNSGEEIEVDNHFVHLNEGVTEKISDEIFKEYSRRTGQFDNNNLKKFDQIDTIQIDRNVKSLEKDMEVVAKSKGVDIKTLWGAVKRGYFEGINGDVDWKKEIDEIFDLDGYYEIMDW